MSVLTKLGGLFRQRCPRCLTGPIYRGWLEMHTACPHCQLRYEREPGYFIGAMYISYALATLGIGVLMLGLHLALPDWDLGWIVLLATGVFVPFVPFTARLARVTWMYFDHWAWPMTSDPPRNP